MGKTPTVVFLSISSFAMRVLSLLCFVIILVFLVPLAVPYISGAGSYPYVKSALRLERVLSADVRRMVPTTILGYNMTRWIAIAGMLILSNIFTRMRRRLSRRAQYHEHRHSLRQWEAKMKLADDSAAVIPLKRTLEQLKGATNKQDREQLLHLFVETKRKLDAFGRDLAFLAIDVVDSTGMKLGEERAIIENDFREYKRFVEKIFEVHGVVKAAWTPDGVMACFTSVDAAVRAGREVVTGLEGFNKNVKSMRRDFVVRCGVNSGFVYFDDSTPLEEISDRTIDVAGHMQKYAEPNTVCVARPSIEPLRDRLGFEPTGKTVDGYEVYRWGKI